jgi:3-keto-5-aminohexanoate cleavage enzyme
MNYRRNVMSYIWNYGDPYEYMSRVEKAEMPPLIITVATTGSTSGKEVNPNIPETPEEQAQATCEAYKAGACVVHIHVRDETGAETSADPARYREVNRRIRGLCPDIIIGNTTGVSPWCDRDEVIKILDAEPEICSLSMGPSLFSIVQKKRQAPLTGRPHDIFKEDVTAVTWREIESIAKVALERNIKPELEITNVSALWQMQRLIKEHLLKKPYWLQLIFNSSCEFPTPQALVKMVSQLPKDSIFSVISCDMHELPMTTTSILMGGHVRVGLEDNLFYRKGELAKSNAQLVERIVRISKELGREIATPAEAREMIGLSQIPRSY